MLARFSCSLRTASHMPISTLHIPSRTLYNGVPKLFFQVEDLLGKATKIQKYSERRVLGWSMEQMYDIAADVSKYNKFVPWCQKSEVSYVSKKSSGHFKANMEVGYGLLKESYVASVSCVEPYLVKSVCTDGLLFNHLICVWRFGPGLPNHPDSCTLDFAVSFEFRSQLHSQLSQMFFDQVVKTMVGAFTSRAREIHGRQSIPRSLRTVEKLS